MATSIFVNLPVKDLDKSKAFAEALGWTINKQFTDETAASVVISDTIYAMLLTHDKYRQFTDKQIADAKKTSQVIIALSQDSKEDVHKLVDAALKAGATEPRPMQDYGFMINRTFEDLDGHTWEVIYMDPTHVLPQ
jgi:predicted lactoylglutathione lyase